MPVWSFEEGAAWQLLTPPLRPGSEGESECKQGDARQADLSAHGQDVVYSITNSGQQENFPGF
jgi:hypothetical protein